MTEAVIVSTARTGLAKSWKGAFNMTYGATLGAHAVQHAVARAGIDPAEVEDVIMGSTFGEGTTGGNIARAIALERNPRAALGPSFLDAIVVRPAIDLARRFFPRLSFDLIYARPNQTLPAWRAELATALSLAADHLSLYQLTIEPGTRFATQHARGDFALPDDDLAAALYDATAETAATFGLAQYEISNYALPGGESRHNLAYWRYLDYAGIGPGAHGRLTLGGHRLAISRHRAPEIWAGLVETTGTGATTEDVIPQSDQAREALLMGLRLAEGIAFDTFATRTGLGLLDCIDPEILAAALDEAYLVQTPTHLIATPEGRKRLDALLPALVL